MSKEDSLDDVIEKAWENVDRTIKQMDRPERLFEVDPDSSALIVIDMQGCFCSPTGSIENPDTRDIVPNINRLAEAFRGEEMPVIWVRMLVDPGGNNAGLWNRFQPKSPIEDDREDPPIALSERSRESEIWGGLEVEDEDYVVEKNRYSPFIDDASDLESLLSDLGVDTLVITGVGTNVCCETAARDAMMKNYKVVFVEDANATIGELFHEVSLMNVKMFFGDVDSTEAIIDEIESS